MKALLIVDMINDFVTPEGSLYVPGSEVIIPKIQELREYFWGQEDLVIFCNDEHDVDDKEFGTWPTHAVKGSDGGKVVAALKPIPHFEWVVGKTRFDAFFKTALDAILTNKGVDDITLVGVVTNICIFATALHAIMLDYKVTVPRDCVKGLHEGDHRHALMQLENVFGIEVL